MANPSSAPAQLYVYITPHMQALYARRGMWINGQPQGVLARMLGPHVPVLSNKCRQVFYLTPGQLADLWVDICQVPIAAIGSRQRAQFGRRLREACQRGGLNFSEILAAKRTGAAMPPPASIGCGSHAVPSPFEPLIRPVSGKARVLFEDHVMKTLRDFVDYTQSSAWQGVQS